MDKSRSTITLTFGDVAENHAGMQKIGQLTTIGTGYNVEDLKEISQSFPGYQLYLLDEMINEGTSAAVLVIRDGLNTVINAHLGVYDGVYADDLFSEMSSLEWDKKAIMYGRVVNKKARYNLCFNETGQEPDYTNGRGRVVAFSSVPLLERLREALPPRLGNKSRGLVCEGNAYYDSSKCYIGWHGDGERRIVIAARLGKTMNLRYKWYKDGKPISEELEILLNHGDMYIMSEKAVGTDWKKRSISTLRHCAGLK